MTTTAEINRSDAELERLEKLLKINKYGLDEELVDHAETYNKVAQRMADAISYRDEAKADLEGTKAKIGLGVRQTFAEAGEKITESGVDARVIADPEYQRALTVLASWNDRVLRWNGLRDAFQQRGYALKDLASLYIAGYWADQSGSSVRSEVRTARADVGRNAVVEAERNRPARRKLVEEAAP